MGGLVYKQACLCVLAGLSTYVGQAAAATDPGYADYATWAGWAALWVGARAGIASSYDRSGGNADYSHYESPEGLILVETDVTIKTLEGPGVIYRYWMPHTTANHGFTVRIFFDGESTPRVDTTSDGLFGGGFSYFAAPLVDTCAGGQVSYEPIPFASSLRIETVNQQIPEDTWSSRRHYYQYSYVTFPGSTRLESFTGNLTPEQQNARAAVLAMYDHVGEHPAGSSSTSITSTTPATTIEPGESLALASLDGPGRVRRIQVRMDTATDDELGSLRLSVTYDSEVDEAINVSVADFFGAGQGRALYRSLPIGTDSPGGFYSYWPMPFHSAVLVELHNPSDDPIAIDSAIVEYEPCDVGTDAAYLRVASFTDVKAAGQVHHPVLQVTGRGHYVGSFLFIEQASNSFAMLEGDEIITVNGTDVLNGTGLEDAYNGGYYYNWVAVQADEPEGVMPRSATRPLHGILYVGREADFARADQYRWQIADRIPFSTPVLLPA